MKREKRVRGRPGKYPWVDWFRRVRVVLRRWEDYDVSQAGMKQQARNAASELGYHLTILDTGDGLVLIAVRKEGVGGAAG